MTTVNTLSHYVPLPSVAQNEEHVKQLISGYSAVQAGAFMVSNFLATLATKGVVSGVKIQGVPPLPAPVAEMDSAKLEKQAYDIAARCQSQLAALERAEQTEAMLTEEAKQAVAGINFAAIKVPQTGNTAEVTEKASHQLAAPGDSLTGTRPSADGMMGGRLNRLMGLIALIIEAEAKNKVAEMHSSTGNAKLSFGLSKVAAGEEIRSGNARRNELITSGVSTLAMTGAGTATAHKGIARQKQALKIHDTNSHQLRAKAMDMNHALAAKPQTGISERSATAAITKKPAQVGQTTSTGSPEIAVNPATTAAHVPTGNIAAPTKRLVDEDAVRQEQDRQILRKTPQELELRAESERMAGEDIRLSGQRTAQTGHAVTSSATALGGIAGSQFGVESSQAQAAKQMADSGSRVMDSSASQQMKQVEAAYALIAALLQVMQQVASAHTEAASAVAQNLRA